MHLPDLHPPYQSFAVVLLVGLVAGWIASQFMAKCSSWRNMEWGSLAMSSSG